MRKNKWRRTIRYYYNYCCKTILFLPPLLPSPLKIFTVSIDVRFKILLRSSNCTFIIHYHLLSSKTYKNQWVLTQVVVDAIFLFFFFLFFEQTWILQLHWKIFFVLGTDKTVLCRFDFAIQTVTYNNKMNFSLLI